MSKRHKAWARQARAAILAKHGNRCRQCGRTQQDLNDEFHTHPDGTPKRGRPAVILELDCILPQGDEHHRMSTDQRATFYRRQDAEGNLQLLCSKCHSEKTLRDAAYEGAVLLASPDWSIEEDTPLPCS